MNKSRQEIPGIDFESNIFTSSEDPLELVFAQQFSDAGGQFVFCENEEEFFYNIQALTSDETFGKIWCGEQELAQSMIAAGMNILTGDEELVAADTSITSCEYLIARTGSIALSSKQASGRRSGVHPDHHIVVARTSQLVYHVKDALKELKTKYPDNGPSLISFITGPSRSADIEKTLIQGAHGAKEIYLFLIDDLMTGETF